MLQDLIKILANDPDATSPTERSDAMKQVAELGAEAVPALIEALASPNSIYLQYILIDIGEPAVPPLITALKDENATRRANVAHTLGRLKTRQAIPALMALLSDKSAEVRKATATAFVNLQSTQAVMPLLRLLMDDDPDVRGSAAQALGPQLDERAIDPLNTVFLEDPDENVRKAAQKSLRQLGYRPDETRIKVDEGWRTRIAELLSETTQTKDRVKPDTFGIPRVELLIATLESTDIHVQRRAVRELVKLGDKAVIPLIGALVSRNANVRAHAAWALGEMGDKRALDSLEAALKDDDENVRYASTQAIQKIKEA